MIDDIDIYDFMKLNHDCTFEEVKKAYHTLLLKYHPDKCLNDNPETVKNYYYLNCAWEILRNEESRRKYDEIRKKNSFLIRKLQHINEYLCIQDFEKICTSPDVVYQRLCRCGDVYEVMCNVLML